MSFPWGITDFAKDKRRIDGSWWISMARHLHVALYTTTAFLGAADRKKVAFSYLCVLSHEKCLPQALFDSPQNALVKSTFMWHLLPAARPGCPPALLFFSS